MRCTHRRSSATRRAINSCARAAVTNRWNLNYGGIALVWRGGCIIRSAFLGDIKKAFDRDPALVNLLLDPFFKTPSKPASGVAPRRRDGHSTRYSTALP